MCAIMGYTAKDIPVSQLQQGFAATKSRGPDDSRFLETRAGTLLFHRLAIMGPEPAWMQPFSSPDGSAVVCNGELYGFRRLKKTLEAKGYVFRSGSDCELILPLLMSRVINQCIEGNNMTVIWQSGALMVAVALIATVVGG